jgi:hypothetical protein
LVFGYNDSPWLVREEHCGAIFCLGVPEEPGFMGTVFFKNDEKWMEKCRKSPIFWANPF